MDKQYQSKSEARLFNFLLEHETLLRSIAAAKKTSEKVSALQADLESLYQELEFSKEDSLMLSEQLNSLAKKYELELLLIKREIR